MKSSNVKDKERKYASSSKKGLHEIGLFVADHVGAMLAYWDKNQICRFANQAYREWFGKKREDMIDKMTMKELLGPLYEKNLPHILEALEGKPQIFEREIPTPSGEIRHSMANYYPDIVDGEVRGFFVQVADITTLKKLEFKLKESELKFKGLLESAPDAIVIVDGKGIIQLINAECKKMFGYEESELYGQPVEVLMPQHFRLKHIVERTDYFLHPQRRPMGIGLDLFGLHKNGKKIPVEISLSPMQSKEGLLVSAAIRDISWKVQKEKLLIQSMEIISNQNKQLLNFAYIVSHNLKSYSNNLASVLDLMIKAKSDKEKNEMIDFLKSISSGFSSTVQNLNEIVDVQSKGNLQLNKVNLYKYIEKCLSSLSIEIKTAGVVVYNHVDGEIEFSYNEVYLESILQNLLTNAIKYRHPDRIPVVELNAFTEEDYLILEVKDNGMGINLEKYRDKIFGLYKTFHGNPEAKGVGLFITKYQVEALRGHIEVQSEEGVGTVFKIYFLIKEK